MSEEYDEFEYEPEYVRYPPWTWDLVYDEAFECDIEELVDWIKEGF